MDTILHILKVIGLILLVLLSFNIIIFVHELGHFLAARWRGLHVDRFQIWFGKPIWKKTINGVQYGLGSIPAGGFVALPQMAPMESIEGDNSDRKEPLPPIKPIDKIIVAFAGPLFSFLLAVFAACIVWFIGVPDRSIPTQQVGFIQADSPAEKAGFQYGDEIIEIEGEPVKGFYGELNSVIFGIIFSEGDEIDFKVIRNGKEVEIVSKFDAKAGTLLQRSGLREVGIAPVGDAIIGSLSKDGPASISGFNIGDHLLKVEGKKVYSFRHFTTLIREYSNQLITVEVGRPTGEKDEKGKDILSPVEVQTMAMTPSNGWKQHDKADLLPLIGIGLQQKETKLKYPNPGKQLKETALSMWITLKKVTSPNSGIGIDQFQSPVGIGKHQYRLLQTDHPVQYIFYFWVLFNINLAIFNLLPFPVLDGGHITMAILEMIRKKPINVKVLEYVQTFCVLMLLSLFAFLVMKDLFSKDGETYTFETIDKKGPTFDLAPLEKALGKGTNE